MTRGAQHGDFLSIGNAGRLESLLYGVKPNDTLTFTAGAIVSAMAALGSAWLAA
jgi:hypothetical protein